MPESVWSLHKLRIRLIKLRGATLGPLQLSLLTEVPVCKQELKMLNMWLFFIVWTEEIKRALESRQEVKPRCGGASLDRSDQSQRPLPPSPSTSPLLPPSVPATPVTWGLWVWSASGSHHLWTQDHPTHSDVNRSCAHSLRRRPS